MLLFKINKTNLFGDGRQGLESRTDRGRVAGSFADVFALSP